MTYKKKIFQLIQEAQNIAQQHGYPNLLQPGLVKELIISDILGHEVHYKKHEHDAHDPDVAGSKFEYLTCLEGGTFQIDRLSKKDAKKRTKSLARITRNTAIYSAVFEKANPLQVKVIYKLSVDKVLEEFELKLNASSNEISHVGLAIKWCEENGEVVYRKDS